MTLTFAFAGALLFYCSLSVLVSLGICWSFHLPFRNAAGNEAKCARLRLRLILAAFAGLIGSAAAMYFISIPGTINALLGGTVPGFLLTLLKLGVTPPRILARSTTEPDQGKRFGRSQDYAPQPTRLHSVGGTGLFRRGNPFGK